MGSAAQGAPLKGWRVNAGRMADSLSRADRKRAMRLQMLPLGGTKGRQPMKFRLYKLAFALGSLAAIAEILGAGRRF
jgi:hypothetical protein